MWYTGLDGKAYNIIYANSTNGINWTKSSVPVNLRGPGQVYGDAIVAYPEVKFHNGEYKMWYSRYDGYYMRTFLAISSDAQNWSDQGLAIDITPSSYDATRSNHCSVLFENNETKAWYTAYNNANWRIMYANITPDMKDNDIRLRWSAPSDDIIRYEVYRETRPPRSRSGATVPPYPE